MEVKEYKKYKCVTCGVRTFQLVIEGQICLSLESKMCSPCANKKIMKIIRGE